MLVSDIARKVRRIFGDTNGVVITDPDILDWVNDGVYQIVRETKIATNSTSAAASTYATPGFSPGTLFVQMFSVLYGTLPLQFESYEDLLAKYSDLTVTGGPIFYYFDAANVWRMYPTPLAADNTTVVWNYSSLPTALTATSQTPAIPERFHEDLVIFCKMRAYERNQDRTSQQNAYAEFNARIGNRVENTDNPEDTYQVIRDDPWEW